MNSNSFRLTPPKATPGLGALDVLRDLYAATPLAILANVLKSQPQRPAPRDAD
jgi:hypothetical protein